MKLNIKKTMPIPAEILTDDTGQEILQPVVVPPLEPMDKTKQFNHTKKLTKNQLLKRKQKAKRKLKKKQRKIARKK